MTQAFHKCPLFLLTRLSLDFVHSITMHTNISKDTKDPQRSNVYQNGTPVHAMKNKQQTKRLATFMEPF